MSIFDLGTKLDYDSSHFVNCCKTIASAIQADASMYQVQHQDIHSRAAGFADTLAASEPGGKNKRAWKEIRQKIYAHSSVARSHPSELVSIALVLYFVFGISSSGVEQGFSKSEWGYTNRRLKAYPDTEEMCLKVLLDLPNHDQKEIINLAQKIWCLCYGVARHSVTPKITKGVPKAAPSKPQSALPEGVMSRTETDFIKQRRAAAALASSSSCRTLDADSLMHIASTNLEVEPGWSDAHSKELEFQKKKLQSRLVQATAEGTHAGNVELRAQVKEVHKLRIKEQRARERKQTRDEIALAGGGRTEILAKIKGETVYVFDGLLSGDLTSAIERNSMSRVALHEANVFVVPIPGQLASQRIDFATYLRGAFQISVEFLLSDGARGLAAKWHAVATIPRVIYVSEGCNDRHRNTIRFMSDVLGTFAGSKIELVLGDSWDRLAALKVKYKKNKSKLIAIVRKSELTGAVLPLGPKLTRSVKNDFEHVFWGVALRS